MSGVTPRLALVPLLGAAGCLYLGSVNQPPVVQLDAPSATSTIKGASIFVSGRASDDQDAPASLDIKFAVASADATPLAACDFTLTQGPHAKSAEVRFFRTGTFAVTAATVDHLGARSNTATVMLTIVDAPPAFSTSAMLIATAPRNHCDVYTAGQTVPLRLEGSVSDADASATNPNGQCAPPEALQYTWRVVGMPSGARPVLTTWDSNNGCATPTAASGMTLTLTDAAAQVCLWTDTVAPASTSMYGIVLDASDGNSTVTSTTADLPVLPDQPPCITGTQDPAGSYVVDRTQLQQFDVTGVVDDLDPLGAQTSQLAFRWSVWRDSDPTWRVVPDWPSPTYQLDTSSFGIGEHVRVRVEAIDRGGSRSGACDPSLDDCAVTSCAAVSGACDVWKTWDLELR